MKAIKPKGRRPIAKDGEKMRNRNFRATDAEWAKCLQLGGGVFLRAKIKAAKVAGGFEPPHCLSMTNYDH